MKRKINKTNFLLLLCGTAIFVVLSIIARISIRLPSDEFEKDVIPFFVALLVMAGVFYLVAVKFSWKNRSCSIFLILLFGLAFRVTFVNSTPILENDFYRYLWDGAVVASGVNPYEHSPHSVSEEFLGEKLENLKQRYGATLEKINHPHIKTIYPPVAQFFFTLSYWISPMNLEAWRILLLLFDLTTFALVLLSLKKLGLPLQNSLIYWWNPLLVKEIFNSVHMDVLVLPFALGAMLLFLYGRKKLWAPALSIAAGIKLWPALLFGVFIKTLTGKRERVVAVALFIFTLAIVFSPMMVAQIDSSSGIVAYGKSWQNNSPFFSLVVGGSRSVLQTLDIHPGHAHWYSRVVILLIMLFWKFYVVFMCRDLDIYRKTLLIAGGLFLLSPTQFPWYYTWVVPFLCVARSPGFLLLTALLPLYYLQYWLIDGKHGAFTNMVVWIEFAPVWILLVWEWLRFRPQRKELLTDRDKSRLANM